MTQFTQHAALHAVSGACIVHACSKHCLYTQSQRDSTAANLSIPEAFAAIMIGKRRGKRLPQTSRQTCFLIWPTTPTDKWEWISPITETDRGTFAPLLLPTIMVLRPTPWSRRFTSLGSVVQWPCVFGSQLIVLKKKKIWNRITASVLKQDPKKEEKKEKKKKKVQTNAYLIWHGLTVWTFSGKSPLSNN